MDRTQYILMGVVIQLLYPFIRYIIHPSKVPSGFLPQLLQLLTTPQNVAVFHVNQRTLVDDLQVTQLHPSKRTPTNPNKLCIPSFSDCVLTV